MNECDVRNLFQPFNITSMNPNAKEWKPSWMTQPSNNNNAATSAATGAGNAATGATGGASAGGVNPSYNYPQQFQQGSNPMAANTTTAGSDQVGSQSKAGQQSAASSQSSNKQQQKAGNVGGNRPAGQGKVIELGSSKVVELGASKVVELGASKVVELGSSKPKAAGSKEESKAVEPKKKSPTEKLSAKTEQDDKVEAIKEKVEKISLKDGGDKTALSASSSSSSSSSEKADAADGEDGSATSNVVLTDGDQREHLNIVCIGHVDAGKSTLSGSFLFEMGIVDKRTIEKFQREAKELNRESWFLAYIMDTNEDERARGKTVEVGKAHFETEKKRYTLLDAPGHKSYVPAMISGASQADVGILVISARKGEFEAGFEKMGQTREHAMLAYTLGLRKLLVVVNKMDDPTVDWDQGRYDEIVKKLLPFLRGCGFKVKKDVYFIPIAALSGMNIKNRLDRSKVKVDWPYQCNNGMSVIETLDSIEISHRDPTAPLRVPILYSYFDRGLNVLGKVEYGLLKIGDKVHVNPTKQVCEITSILVSDTVAIRVARPGENVQLLLKGLNEGDCQKGFVLANEPLGTTVFIATLRILDLLEHRPIFSAGYHAVLHVHTAVEECVVEKLLYGHDPETKKPIKKVKYFAKSEEYVTVRIRVAQKVCVETHKQNEVLGRFTLRDEGKTIAIGKIIKLEDDEAGSTVKSAATAASASE